MRPKLSASLAVIALIPVIITNSSATAVAAQSTVVTLNMDGQAAKASSTTPVSVAVVSANDGQVEFIKAREGKGRAASFPAYGSEQNAAITVTNAGSTDMLSPGTQDFSFGLEFQPAATGSADGDNLVQRGLAGDSGQYKIQVDYGIVSCRIKGTSGDTLIRMDTKVSSDTWYSAQCSRHGSQISLTVVNLGSGSKWSKSSIVDVGSVTQKKVSTPFTVGAKVTPWLKIAAASPDQFNGLIDNVFLKIGS